MFYRDDLLRAAAAASKPPLTHTDIAAKTKLSRHTVGRVMGGDPNVGFLTLHTVASFLGYEDMGPLMVADSAPQTAAADLETALPKQRIA